MSFKSKFFKGKKKYIIASIVVALVIGVISYVSVTSGKNESLASNKTKKVKAVAAEKNNADKKALEQIKEKNQLNKNNNEIQNKQISTQKKQTSVQKKQLLVQKKNNQKISNTKKQSKNVVVKKVQKVTVSDGQIRTLLSNGYMIQRKLENKYLTSLQDAKIGDKDYKKVPERFKNKQSIYNYCGKEFGLNKYYTTRHIKSIVDYVVKNINGKYYAMIGQSGEYLNLRTIKITSKNYRKNRLYITFDANSEDGEWSHYKATLVKNGQRWLIDSCNFLID